MKQIITTFLILSGFWMAMSQPLSERAEVTAVARPESTASEAVPYNVSSEPTPAHILIEEFTGLHCSYCPQAHAIANNLTYVAGERLHVMAVHVGSLAAPTGDEVDLRSKYGQTFYGWQGEGGMPSGNINRTVYPGCIGGGYSLPRGAWAGVSKDLLASATPAPMNLYVAAYLDSTENRIYIDVEAYSAETAEVPLYLNVALTENFVPGTQAGSPLRTYLHRHVLRDMVTGVFGDTLTAAETAQGAYLRRSYTYTLPEKFNNRAPNKANLACLVFVTDGDRAVLNSAEAEVESPFKAPLDYLQINLYNLEKTYGGPVYDVYVVNPSDDTLRSLTFTLDIDGDTRTYQLDGLSLSPKTESVVRLTTDFDASKYQKTNVYTLKLTEANGRAVEANQIKDKFSQPLTLPSAAFKVSFTSDLFGSENTLVLSDEEGQILYEAGPFADGEIKTHTSGLIKAEAGQVYTLRVTDAFRDGVYSVPEDQDYRQCGVQLMTETDSVFYRSTVGTYGHLVSFRLAGGASDDTTVTSAEDRLRAAEAAFTATLRPNPANTQTVLQVEGLVPETEVCVRIYNLQGRLMVTRSGRPQAASNPAGMQAASNPAAMPSAHQTLTCPLDVSGYPQGLYLVRVEQGHRQQVVKLIIRK